MSIDHQREEGDKGQSVRTKRESVESGGAENKAMEDNNYPSAVNNTARQKKTSDGAHGGGGASVRKAAGDDDNEVMTHANRRKRKTAGLSSNDRWEEVRQRHRDLFITTIVCTLRADTRSTRTQMFDRLMRFKQHHNQ